MRSHLWRLVALALVGSTTGLALSGADRTALRVGERAATLTLTRDELNILTTVISHTVLPLASRLSPKGIALVNETLPACDDAGGPSNCFRWSDFDAGRALSDRRQPVA